MIIGIDASRATVRRRTGTEGYSFNVIRGLIELGAAHQFRLYFRDDPPEDLFPARPNVEHVVIRRSRLWTHVGLRAALRANRPNVLFVPAHVIPWPNAMGVPAVVTIHDLGYLYYPEKHPLFDRLYLNWSTRHSARMARRVIVESDRSRPGCAERRAGGKNPGGLFGRGRDAEAGAGRGPDRPTA
jgi:hypothetical protein